MTEADVGRKARGAFFTPREISSYIAEWAIRSGEDAVLEPSCGEASFLLEAGRRLKSFGLRKRFLANQLHGVEIYKHSADEAVSLLAAEGFGVSIKIQDFFDLKPAESYDAVIGNPPYVRYQSHTGTSRLKSIEAALARGVRLNGLASSWAAFTVHAASFLKPNGRLGLVLPAELLSVNYAGPVRRFLLQRFSRVRLIVFETLIFPQVLEEVVLLLAEGSGGAKCFEVYQARDLGGLPEIEAVKWQEHVPGDDEKWTPALLAPAFSQIYSQIRGGAGFEKLSDWGRTYLGAVTGSNDFFTLSHKDAADLGLRNSDVVRISPPGARHLRGLRFGLAAWEGMARDGAKCLLFRPQKQPSAAAERYIARGAAAGVHRAYKCSVREPWWRVPLVDTPDLLFTYMNHERPRLVSNDASIHILNSLYGVRLAQGRKVLGKDLLPLACLNSLTLLGAELVGRSYGGGLLKLEPREADELPVPSKSVLLACSKELKAFAPQLAPLLGQGKLSAAVEAVDGIILARWLSASHANIKSLREARESLFQRRVARGKTANVAS